MKKTLLFILLSFFIILSGCSSKDEASISEKFILEFYTVNDISGMQTSFDKLNNSPCGEEDVIEFHKPLSEFMTDRGLEGIVLDRQYIRICEWVLNENVTLEPINIVINESEGSIDFSLTVKAVNLSSKAEKEVNQTGQIVISDNGKIDSVYFYNIGELQQCIVNDN